MHTIVLRRLLAKKRTRTIAGARSEATCQSPHSFCSTRRPEMAWAWLVYSLVAVSRRVAGAAGVDSVARACDRRCRPPSRSTSMVCARWRDGASGTCQVRSW